MRLRNLMLGVVAALATIAPARADVIYTFNLLNSQTANQTIPNNLGTGSVGPAITSLTLPNVGDVRYVALCVTVTAAPSDAWQNGWNAIDPFGSPPGAGLTGTGANLTFNPAIANTPFNSNGAQDVKNFRIQTAGVGYSAATLPQPPAGLRQYATITTDGLYLGANAADGSNPANNTLNTTPLAAFMIVGVANGTTNYVVSKLTQNADPNGGPLAIWQWINSATGQGPFGEGTVFGPTHVTFTLPVTVGVPEPSSMCLAGIAFAGLGWRKLRRKKA